MEGPPLRGPAIRATLADNADAGLPLRSLELALPSCLNESQQANRLVKGGRSEIRLRRFC